MPYKWQLISFIVLFSIITIEGLGSIDRFYITNNQLLLNSSFKNLEHWIPGGRGSAKVSGEELVLRTNAVDQNQGIRQRLHLPAGHYRYSVEVHYTLFGEDTASKIASGSIGIIVRDSSGKRIARIGSLNLQTERNWQWQSEVVTLEDPLTLVEFHVRLHKAHGVLKARNPAISSLSETSLYKWLRAILFVVISAFSVSVTFRFFSDGCFQAWKKSGKKLGFLTLMCMVVIVMVTGAVVKSAMVKEIFFLFPNVYEGDELFEWVSNDIFHLIAFGMLGFLVGVGYRGSHLLFPFSVVVALAFFTEAIQMFTNDRTASYTDVMTDIVGLVVGMFIAIISVKIGQLITKIFDRAREAS